MRAAVSTAKFGIAVEAPRDVVDVLFHAPEVAADDAQARMGFSSSAVARGQDRFLGRARPARPWTYQAGLFL